MGARVAAAAAAAPPSRWDWEDGSAWGGGASRRAGRILRWRGPVAARLVVDLRSQRLHPWSVHKRHAAAKGGASRVSEVDPPSFRQLGGEFDATRKLLDRLAGDVLEPAVDPRRERRHEMLVRPRDDRPARLEELIVSRRMRIPASEHFSLDQLAHIKGAEAGLDAATKQGLAPARQQSSVGDGIARGHRPTAHGRHCRALSISQLRGGQLAEQQQPQQQLAKALDVAPSHAQSAQRRAEGLEARAARRTHLLTSCTWRRQQSQLIRMQPTEFLDGGGGRRGVESMEVAMAQCARAMAGAARLEQHRQQPRTHHKAAVGRESQLRSEHTAAGVGIGRRGGVGERFEDGAAEERRQAERAVSRHAKLGEPSVHSVVGVNHAARQVEQMKQHELANLGLARAALAENGNARILAAECCTLSGRLRHGKWMRGPALIDVAAPTNFNVAAVAAAAMPTAAVHICCRIVQSCGCIMQLFGGILVAVQPGERPPRVYAD